MKLYNMDLSNFATKCRIAIYEKNAAIEIVPVPGGSLKSPEYLAVYPLGMVPSLDTGHGVIGESQAIVELVNDNFDGPSLLPADPVDKAKVRFLCGLHDTHLEPPLRAMFGHINPDKRDPDLVDEKLAVVNAKLDAIEAAMSGDPFLAGADFSLADCALASTGSFLEKFIPVLGGDAFPDSRPKLKAWWAQVQSRPSVNKALTEHREAIKQTFGM